MWPSQADFNDINDSLRDAALQRLRGFTNLKDNFCKTTPLDFAGIGIFDQ